MRARRWLIPLLLLAAGCEREATWNGSLESLLESRPDRFGTVMENPAAHRVQIIYTQIDRDADNVPSFQSFTYRVDDDEYFYPASTVKLPTAQAISTLRRGGFFGGRPTAAGCGCR